MPSFSVLAESEGFFALVIDCRYKNPHSDFALVSRLQTRSASARNR